MGCDIHLFGEVKVNGKWHAYCHPDVRRNYALFSIMAGVRSPKDPEQLKRVEPITQPRGLPSDISLVAGLSCKAYGDGGHSHSYLTSEEIALLDHRWELFIKAQIKDASSKWFDYDLDVNYFGYLEGNSWAGFHKYPKEREKWMEDVRFVFWFDN